MINVILVDDQKIVREGIKMILSLDDEIKVVNEAENGKELVEFLKTNEYPDVILMDVRMPIMDGVQATKIVKENFKNIKVIILTTFNEDEYIFDGIKNGADGYILKDAGSEEIIKAIKTAYSGNILLNPEVATKIVRAYTAISSGKQTSSLLNEEKKKLEILTKRELEVAKLVAQGKSNKEICLELFITEGTVKNYLTKIFEKLELASRTELALLINQTNI
ncbi:DNA-binding NarL/FixJ family response regulator [Clostridium saccharoperbutylacetonicum]|uniref:Stage 0 sporulation protein A homolog n=1 Tax=Clostridium saccharoperbutylacetonicum N1-4(HMT) TaxID=931276 RepID=M1MQM2_9CLOT|nr:MULTISPECIES: response regulator transcription factor [Clostridium]AGF58488.1 two component transcriptional regulator, LuxR family [Clostridium saccharoperbutylacetonicum N1-4(HMT)]NRT60734.1 DNA-binding NarL/FixJ family response regulator [Clostridium saccharoperbutylacetonicum]NSB24048.1 DNA-binding NarL/FixJ family response regulator [Clostridium saccharoperbutylacetonicum]NSB43426.1 DNA-binding NarL/FixJ family response regulator [Clostridium saccharoperbutylacetonicum]